MWTITLTINTQFSFFSFFRWKRHNQQADYSVTFQDLRQKKTPTKNKQTRKILFLWHAWHDIDWYYVAVTGTVPAGKSFQSLMAFGMEERKRLSINGTKTKRARRMITVNSKREGASWSDQEKEKTPF